MPVVGAAVTVVIVPRIEVADVTGAGLAVVTAVVLLDNEGATVAEVLGLVVVDPLEVGATLLKILRS